MFNETFDLVINGHVLLSGNRTGVVPLIFKQRTTKVLIITQTQFSYRNAITPSWRQLNARPDVKDIYYYTPILSVKSAFVLQNSFQFHRYNNKFKKKWQITLCKHAHALCRDVKICKMVILNENFDISHSF